VWPVSLQQPVPRLAVPLAKPDPDIDLELQSMIDAIYERFRYDRSVDYAQPLTPPLGPEEMVWLQKQLGKATARKHSS
jgi:hypothetical protein